MPSTTTLHSENMKNQIKGSGLAQRFRQQQRPYRGSKHGQHLGAALNRAQVTSAEHNWVAPRTLQPVDNGGLGV